MVIAGSSLTLFAYCFLGKHNFSDKGGGSADKFIATDYI
jgi:hypothetical protein